MSKHIKAIGDIEGLCFKCLSIESKLNIYYIYRDDYGSSFDNMHTKLQICTECEPPNLKEWFDESPEMIDGYCANYKHEKDIIEFVKSFPLEGQELFWNRMTSGACAYTMDSQDWIDEKLGILPDEKYEDYGMYSPRQINAYKERFPTCEHPVNVVYNDKSKACYCPHGAMGDYGQNSDEYNISDECFGCEHYKLRETKIKEMDKNTYDKYEKYIQGIKYKDLFE